MTLSDNVTLLLPELFLSIAAMVLLLVGVYLRGDRAREVGLGAAVCLVAAVFIVLVTGHAETVSAFEGAFVDDTLARSSKAFIFVAALISLLLADRFFQRERLARPEYPVLILLACVGMALMVSSTDLISLYMGIELQSLAAYVMAAFNRDSRRSTEAGLKYFVLGALSSGLLLYGASLVYGFTGSTQFDAIAAVAGGVESPVGLTFGLVFLISGVAFKVSAAPFHMWTPDVYEGSPTPVTAFFAAAPKLAGMVLFGRVLVEAFPSLIDQWQPIVWLLSAASMIVGALSALVQTNIKRLMAYSSIGHIGYALMGLAAGTEAGISSVVIYMVIYLIMTLGTFACILSMRRSEGMAENISDLAGLSQTQRGLAFAFTFLFISLAGIPIFIGFFAKFFVFMAAVGAGLYVLAAVGVITSVVATYYYLSVIKTIWFDEPQTGFVRENGPAVRLTAALASIVTVVGILVAIGPLRAVAEAAAAPLF
ncbi:NADH-quinone oxidoreductase subunit NuoN [Parvularcula dongshanensis]|uniref:NADH-quinone oxidoreductase subunit N n=1 Tax=Parvularcula dongshanensis TaxID=1173995 RepID=A0A840I4I8_9PROT|nr:NADH-quinone oxidoreductase subunit NuoN [Parvularcula dongshanensis]MBB4659769.1 NADH-quinone oxidoreductase subunit N [Parvularcula dongshanensis]